MKFSEAWLREWIDSPADVHEWSEKLTLLGLEVESIDSLGTQLENIRVGQVISTTRHPDADRLSVCQVSIGDDNPLTIVCGAANVRAGLKVAVAMVGAILPNNITIKRAKIRGVESHGMLCSSSELGLAETSNGILELPADAPIGSAFNSYFQLPDHLLDVNITPNRGDCFSVMGLARELNAGGQWPYTPVATQDIPAQISDTLPIKLLSPQDCPRYIGRIIRGIRQDATSPIWLQERLRRSGIRSIHPVVDVMNYVMLELGQPLHAFDLKTITSEIQVRLSKPNEQINLLDGQTLTLDKPALVIADQKQALALAGIMGGADSAVTTATVDIFIESAFFTPDTIRPTLRRYNLKSDAAHRFERGVDPELSLKAIQRASELVLNIAGGQPGPVIEVTDSAHFPKPISIELRSDRIARILGITLPASEVTSLLNRLHLQAQSTSTGWKVTVPSYRFDLNIEVDLIEELARLYGYTRLPSRRLHAPLTMLPAAENQLTLTRVREFFADHGYHETINYSFTHPRLAALLSPQQAVLPLANPISADMSVMRTSLWPALIQAALFNLNRQQQSIRLFEIGVCFTGDNLTSTNAILGDLQQRRQLAGIIAGNLTTEQWGVSSRQIDFFDIKGDLEKLFSLTQENSFQFISTQHPALHPGRAAEIYRNDKSIGYLGELHPQLQQTLELPVPVYLFELMLDDLLPAALPHYIAPSKYPSIRRDLAFIVDQSISFQQVSQQIRTYAGEALQKLQLFDIYQGQGIAPGQKSMAIGLTFQLTSRTLIDEEVDKAIQHIVGGLAETLRATLRE